MRDHGEAIARIEQRRAALAVPHEQLAAKAGVSASTWRRMRASGRGKKRTVHALSMALRSIGRELDQLAAQYEAGA